MQRYNQHRNSGVGDGELSKGQFALCGALAGAFAGACTTPLDVIKTRIMLADVSFLIFSYILRRFMLSIETLKILICLSARIVEENVLKFLRFDSFEIIYAHILNPDKYQHSY